MSQRKKTPDILGDLLGSKSAITPPAPQPVAEPTINQPIAETKRQQAALLAKQQEVMPAKQQTDLTAKPQNGLTSSQQAVLPAKQQRVKPVKPQVEDVDLDADEAEPKTKITFYLSEDSVERLEEAQRSLRRMAKRLGKVQPKGLTSKSALLEEALKLACYDLEENGPKSRFASLIS